MTLSEAIRLGAMLKPQGRMGIVHRQHTCVLGAALDAVGALQPRRGMPHSRFYVIAKERWPLLAEERCHPITQGSDEVEWICIDLNDNHHWTRERIADWVATIEAAEAPAAREAEAVIAKAEGRC